jgi:threonine/homoserine/homoserine lactone efflux protein
MIALATTVIAIAFAALTSYVFVAARFRSMLFRPKLSGVLSRMRACCLIGAGLRASPARRAS